MERTIERCHDAHVTLQYPERAPALSDLRRQATLGAWRMELIRT